MSTIAENILKTLKSWLASSDVPTTVTPTQLVMKSDDTGKEYLVHPETEVAMIVDWDDKTSGFQQSTNLGNDILKNLASTAAMTAVTALTTDSWFGKLLKFVLDASGVKYSLEQNGYICLGSFFGGLIIQWGIGETTSTRTWFNFPITCEICWAVIVSHIDRTQISEYQVTPITVQGVSNTGFFARCKENDASPEFVYLSICK